MKKTISAKAVSSLKGKALCFFALCMLSMSYKAQAMDIITRVLDGVALDHDYFSIGKEQGEIYKKSISLTHEQGDDESEQLRQWAILDMLKAIFNENSTDEQVTNGLLQYRAYCSGIITALKKKDMALAYNTMLGQPLTDEAKLLVNMYYASAYKCYEHAYAIVNSSDANMIELLKKFAQNSEGLDDYNSKNAVMADEQL